VRAESRKRQVRLACVTCGKPFLIPQSHVSRRSNCSRECVEKSEKTMQRKASWTGENNSAWKGGVVNGPSGYIYEICRDHPFVSSSPGSYVLQHRLIAERFLRHHNANSRFLVEIDGEKYLAPDFEVHHIDRDRKNNDPANLVVCTKQAHKILHAGRTPKSSEFWLLAPI
jgi:hypothetical protein